jgi:PAS domain S-box-containing protein
MPDEPEWAVLRAVADAMPVMLWQSGPDKSATYVNQRWLDFTGRSHAQEAGDGWLSAVHPQDVQECLATYLAAFDEQRESEMHYRLRRFDGEYRWILDRGAPMLLDGELIGYVRGCIDISDRTQLTAEQQIEIYDQALQSLFGIGLITTAALADLGDDGASPQVVTALREIGELVAKCTTSLRELIEALALKVAT